MIAEATCTARNASVSSDRLRCTACSVKRGHRALATRPVWIAPSTVVAVSSSAATRPVPRLANQRRLSHLSPPSPSPARGGRDRAVEGDEPRRQVALLEPGRGARTHDDRRGARGVRVDAGRGRDARGPPARVRHVARAGVDDVVHGPSAPSPGADSGSRRGDGARDDGDGRCPGRRVPRHGRRRSAIRQPPGGAAPAARTSPPRLTSTPQPAAVGGTDGDPVGGQGLRRGAEVELDADRHEHLAVGRVPPHSPPPGAGTAGAAGSARSVTIAAKSRS